jgi:uncharacterized membrane protein YjdF
MYIVRTRIYKKQRIWYIFHTITKKAYTKYDTEQAAKDAAEYLNSTKNPFDNSILN